MKYKLNYGDVVKMSASYKRSIKKVNQDHLKEFGDCQGVVEGPVDYGKDQQGPELDVRWLPSGLRYGYTPKDLTLVRKGSLPLYTLILEFRGGTHVMQTLAPSLDQALVNAFRHWRSFASITKGIGRRTWENFLRRKLEPVRINSTANVWSADATIGERLAGIIIVMTSREAG